MKRMGNLRVGLAVCAVTTVAMGTGSRLIAQDQPINQRQSNPPAASEPQQRGADQTGRQTEQSRDQTEQGRTGEQGGHQEGARGPKGLGLQFEAQSSSGRGLEISSVAANSAAERAGLRAHDKLISIDGRPFKHHRHAKAYMAAQTGRPVPLIIERDGRQYMIQFVAGEPEGDSGWVGILLYGENEMPPNGPSQPVAQSSGPDGSQNAQNAQSAPGNNQNPSNGAQNAPGQPGARVAQVYPGSPAARGGLQPGDLVTQINGTKIDDPAELIALVSEMKPQTQAEFEVTRDNQPQKMSVTIGSRANEFAQSQYGPEQGQAGPAQGQSGPGQAGVDPNALQRIEEEMRQLREEIRQLREQLQKK